MLYHIDPTKFIAMEAILQEAFEGRYAPITAAKRIGYILRLADKNENFDFLNDTRYVLSSIDSYSKVSTRWTYLNHVIETIKVLPADTISMMAKNEYNKKYEKLRIEYTKWMGDNVKTLREEGLLNTTLPDQQQALRDAILAYFNKYDVPMVKINKASVKRLGDKFIPFVSGFQDLMYMALYLFQPALRSNYATMRVLTKRDKTGDFNYLLKRGSVMKIIMRKFKNHNTFGDTEIDVYSELKPLIVIWLSALSHLGFKATPDYLIHYRIGVENISYNGSDATLARNIPRVAQRILGKDFNIDGFRKLWEIHWQSQPEYAKMTRNQRTELHTRMLHHPYTAELYNRK